MAQFVEKYNGPSRKKIFRQYDRANIPDIPSELHVLKSESLDNLTITELFENFLEDKNFLLMANSGDFIQLQDSAHKVLGLQ